MTWPLGGQYVVMYIEGIKGIKGIKVGLTAVSG
jgi:hypothetical protein